MSEHGYEQPVGAVLQEDPLAGPVRVEVVGPVVTQSAPAIDGDLYSVQVDNGGYEQVAVADPRRQVLVVWSDQIIRLSTSREGAGNPNAALLAAETPIAIRHRAAVWCKGTVNTTTVSASVERWAD